MEEAINHPDTNFVVVGLPNHFHEGAIALAAAAGKAGLCTKPLARTAYEAKRILDSVEKAGVFAGYLEDPCYTPKTLKAIAAVQSEAVGDVTWVRSREAHPGPHSAWFWDALEFDRTLGDRRAAQITNCEAAVGSSEVGGEDRSGPGVATQQHRRSTTRRRGFANLSHQAPGDELVDSIGNRRAGQTGGVSELGSGGCAHPTDQFEDRTRCAHSYACS